MFKKMYKKNYKSRKTISPELKKQILNEIQVLKEKILSKIKSIEKFTRLAEEDPDNKQIYEKHMLRHQKFISKAKQEIEKKEMILLDS